MNESQLLDRAIDVMSALHRAIEPMQDDPEIAGRVPPEAMRAFVDALADIDRERYRIRRAPLAVADLFDGSANSIRDNHG